MFLADFEALGKGRQGQFLVLTSAGLIYLPTGPIAWKIFPVPPPRPLKPFRRSKTKEERICETGNL